MILAELNPIKILVIRNACDSSMMNCKSMTFFCEKSMS